MMRKLRRLADRTGWTVEDLINEGILEFVAKCQAKTELKNSQVILRVMTILWTSFP
jgi:hypothetical protein